jgi:hypothetical protein
LWRPISSFPSAREWRWNNHATVFSLQWSHAKVRLRRL